MGEIRNGGGKYHKLLKILKLSKKDHAIVFRNDGGDNLKMEIFIGSDKNGPTAGGLIAMGLATNAFDQSFMDKIVNQITMSINNNDDNS